MVWVGEAGNEMGVLITLTHGLLNTAGLFFRCGVNGLSLGRIYDDKRVTARV